MRPIQPHRRRSSASFWLGLLLIMLMGCGGVVGLLLLLGINLNPFAGPTEDPFMVRIPINSHAIPAYERVSREHLLNPITGGLMYQRIPPQATVGMSITGVTTDGSHVEDQVESVRNVDDTVVFVVSGGREVAHGNTLALGGAIMNVNAIIGRVVKKDKRAGLGFQESTFFPQGTPEGIAGATPRGMRAITLDATKLTGVHALNAGDQIDLMASVPVGDIGSFQSQHNSQLPGAALVASTSSGGADSATEPMLLAEGAVVLKPVYVRNEATTSASLTQGKRIQNVPKYEVAIAVAPDDVIPLQSALNKSLSITCITHSMQPEAASSEAVAHNQSELMAPVTVRPILAYGVVTREAFVSTATRRVRLEPISRQQADRLGVVLSIDEALGAVARHDIPAGSFIRSQDLLNGSLRESNESDNSAKVNTTTNKSNPFHFVSQPHAHTHAAQPSSGGASVVGDRPAVTNFIPAGRVAIALPWNLLYGAEHLQIDDHVDIIGSYQLERTRDVRKTEKRADDSVVTSEFEEVVERATDRTIPESLGKRGEPWFVAADAIVVGPVGFPAPNAALRVIGDAKPNANAGGTSFSHPAILFAIDQRDVEALTTALNTEEILFSLTFRPKQVDETPVGYIRIAVAPVELPAFELFSDLNWKGLRREMTTRLVREDDANFRDAIRVEEIDNYYGRVLKSAKLRFEHFTADDFMPVGVESGVAAGIGGSTVAVTVTTDQIAGLGRFVDNDRVAIILTGNLELPQNAVYHGIAALGSAAQVVVQKARIVRAASDTSDVVTLEISTNDAAAFGAALFSNDATGSDEKHSSRLMAVALARQGGTTSGENDPLVSTSIPNHLPIKQAPTFQAIVGRETKTHIFEAQRKELP